MSTIQPEDNKQLKDDLKEQSRFLSDLANIAESEGGKRLLESLSKAVTSQVNQLCAKYADMNESAIKASIASIGEKLLLLNTIATARADFDATQFELERWV